MLELDDIADVIAGAVREATAPLLARIDALEQRELLLPEKGDPGEPGPAGEVDTDAIEVLVGAKVADAVAAIPVPQDGKSVDIAEVKQLIEQAVAEIPPARDGSDCDMSVVKAMIAEEVVVAVSTVPPAEKGEPGRDADMEEIGNRIETAVKAAVDALPAPKGGEPGKDGLGLADALRDAEGNLVLVMTDGRTKSLGPVNGKDGRDGNDGKDGETFSLDDFDIEPLDERSIKLKFIKGEVCHSFELEFPVPVYRGVYREGEAYERADMVTWAGSLWHADKATSEKPDTPDGGWRLAVKRGRDGKDYRAA